MLLATWNVNSVRARLDHVVRYLGQRAPDVLCLQELKVREEEFPSAPVTELGMHLAVAGQKTYNGVAILSKSPLSNVVRGFPHLSADHELNSQSRLIAATVDGVRVISAYVPNGEAVGSDKFEYKLAFFHELRSYLDRAHSPSEPLCLVGDFNVAPQSMDVYDPEAWEGRILCSDTERDALARVHAFGLVDCFRMHHGEGGRFSWWDYRGGAFWKDRGLRIDHVLATAPLAERCTASDIDVSPRKWKRPSDHAPVWAEFDAG